MIASADAICVRRNAEVDAAKPTGALSTSVIADLASRHASIEHAALSELSKLAPPRSLARGWQRLLAYRRTLDVQLDRMATYAARNDAAGIQSFVVASERVKRQLLSTERYGFSSCSLVE